MGGAAASWPRPARGAEQAQSRRGRQSSLAQQLEQRAAELEEVKVELLRSDLEYNELYEARAREHEEQV